MAKYTLTLEDNTARMLEQQVSTSGGSVPGFAAALITPFAKLPLHLQEHARKQILDLLTQHEAAQFLAAGTPAPAQPPLTSEAGKRHAQFSRQHQPTRPLRFPKGKRGAKEITPAVGV